MRIVNEVERSLGSRLNDAYELSLSICATIGLSYSGGINLHVGHGTLDAS